MSKQNSAKKLFTYIGDIDNTFIEETESLDAITKLVSRQRNKKYGAFAAASIGIAVTYWLFKTKKLDTNMLTKITKMIPAKKTALLGV